MPDRPTRQWIAALTLTLLITTTACSGSATPGQSGAAAATSPTVAAQPTSTTIPTTTSPPAPAARPERTISTTPVPQEEPSAPADAIDDQEAEVANRLSARRDLEAAATATPRDDGTFLIDAAMRVLDRGSVFDPTLIFTPSDGVQLVDPPSECITQGRNIECTLAVYFSQAATGSERSFPTDWLPLTVTAAISPDAPEPHQITITTVSDENGLDNDPDPTNNVVTLELSP